MTEDKHEGRPPDLTTIIEEMAKALVPEGRSDPFWQEAACTHLQNIILHAITSNPTPTFTGIYKHLSNESASIIHVDPKASIQRSVSKKRRKC